MSDTTDKTPVTEADQNAAQDNAQARGINPEELHAVLTAAAAFRENKAKVIRTKDLDFELEQCKNVINSFLSRNAHDALHALEFMYLIVPNQISQLSQIFAQHKMTYMPMVTTLNQIANSRREAAEAAKEAVNAETT